MLRSAQGVIDRLLLGIVDHPQGSQPFLHSLQRAVGLAPFSGSFEREKLNVIRTSVLPSLSREVRLG